jgi:hypothetical protein
LSDLTEFASAQAGQAVNIGWVKQRQ